MQHEETREFTRVGCMCRLCNAIGSNVKVHSAANEYRFNRTFRGDLCECFCLPLNIVGESGCCAVIDGATARLVQEEPQ